MVVNPPPPHTSKISRYNRYIQNMFLAKSDRSSTSKSCCKLQIYAKWRLIGSQNYQK